MRGEPSRSRQARDLVYVVEALVPRSGVLALCNVLPSPTLSFLDWKQYRKSLRDSASREVSNTSFDRERGGGCVMPGERVPVVRIII